MKRVSTKGLQDQIAVFCRFAVLAIALLPE